MNRTDTDPREYVLGTHDAELERLGVQHRLWGAQAYALWERAGFALGNTLLDVGCGPGYATLDLAQLVGSAGRVFAVDESGRFIATLREKIAALQMTNIDARVADVQKLDLAPASIDGAYARWVLCFVPDPEAAIAGVARALRPGACFAIQDYFNYEGLSLAPRSAIMQRVVQAVAASWRARGGDPDFVGRVPALFEKHGLAVREIRPHLRVARPGDPLWQWPTTFFRNFVPTLVQGGWLTPADQAEFEREWSARSRDPHTFFQTPLVFDVLGEKR